MMAFTQFTHTDTTQHNSCRRKQYEVLNAMHTTPRANHTISYLNKETQGTKITETISAERDRERESQSTDTLKYEWTTDVPYSL